MPRYLHIPHTPDTARTLTLSGRNCLVVSGMVTPSLKSAKGAIEEARVSPASIYGFSCNGAREVGLFFCLRRTTAAGTTTDAKKQTVLIHNNFNL